MTDLKESVKAKLKNEGASKACLQLCDDMFKWYDEVGPSLVEEKISKKLRILKLNSKKRLKK